MAADLRLRPRGHWDRLPFTLPINKVLCSYADMLLDLPLITYFLPFQQSSIPSNHQTFVIGRSGSNPEQVDYEI